MGKRAHEKDAATLIDHLRYGRDEMNLLEHSISSAGTKVDRETRSVVFHKADTDPETKEPVERTWEVSFSKYGRPTAIDDDVFVALLKVSSDCGFTDKRVEFTRYELCKILGWPDNGQNYRKIDDALRRITGVYITATNFWYDNRAKGWRDRNFHILDASEVFNRERLDQERRVSGGHTPKSWVQWSDTMMESFSAGYIRKLDLHECLSLDNPVARKLYRYLGMQFYYRTQLCIDLVVLCCEKLGYKKGTEPNELKRKVLPAISQLECRGIYGLSHKFHSTYGQCEVVFKAKSPTKEIAKKKTRHCEGDESPLVTRLVAIGVKREDAIIAVQTHSPERIDDDILHVEFEERAGRIKASKAGMLASMLKSETPWPRPKGLSTSTTRAEANSRREGERVQAMREQSDRQKETARKRRCDAYLLGLDVTKRKELENQAIHEGDASLRAAYGKWEKKGGVMAEVTLRALVEDFVQTRMGHG